MTRISLGPVSLDILDFNSLLTGIKHLIEQKKPSQIVTLNALMFNLAYNNTFLANIIENASLVIPDSFGIVWAAKTLSGCKVSRYPGIDLIDNLCIMARDSGYSVFLLGSRQDVLEQTERKLCAKYPGLKIAGKHHGFFSPSENNEIIGLINNVKPDILLVGFDIPRQEVWIASNLSALNVPVIMGIGGSFDVISGKLKRAPLWMQRFGLEWLFRFIQQPWRIVRIKGLPLFVYNVIKIKYFSSKIKHEIRNTI